MSSNNNPEISSRVRTLADAIAFQFPDESKAVATGDGEVYVNHLAEGLKEHGAYASFEKKLPSILAKDVPVEEKTGMVMDALYHKPEEVAKAIQEYDAEFFAAVSLALGETGQKYIAEHKDANRVVGTVKTIGRNKFSSVYDHVYTKTIPNGKGEDVTKEEAYGRVVVSHDVYGNRKSAEQMIAVRNHLAESARKSLAD